MKTKRLQQSIDGLDSPDLETRIKSAVFILNEKKNDHANRDALREVSKNLERDFLQAPASLHFSVLESSNQPYLLANLFQHVACKGEKEAALHAIDMLMFACDNDSNSEASKLARIAEFAEDPVMREKAKNALSKSLYVYQKMTETNSYYLLAITYVAEQGDESAAAIAYQTIIDCKNVSSKLFMLDILADCKRQPYADKAKKELCKNFDEIAALKYEQFFIKSSCLDKLVKCSVERRNKKMYLKVMDEFVRPLENVELLGPVKGKNKKFLRNEMADNIKFYLERYAQDFTQISNLEDKFFLRKAEEYFKKYCVDKSKPSDRLRALYS